MRFLHSEYLSTKEIIKIWIKCICKFMLVICSIGLLCILLSSCEYKVYRGKVIKIETRFEYYSGGLGRFSGGGGYYPVSYAIIKYDGNKMTSYRLSRNEYYPVGSYVAVTEIWDKTTYTCQKIAVGSISDLRPEYRKKMIIK